MAKNIEINYETVLKAFELVDSKLHPGSISWAMEMANQLNNSSHVCQICGGIGKIRVDGEWDCTGFVGGKFVKCPPCDGVGRFETAEEAEKAKLDFIPLE